jgi:hypothetical protein
MKAKLTLAIPVLLGLAELAGCSDETPSDVRFESIHTPQFSYGGSVSIPVPPTNEAVGRIFVGQIGPNQWATVRVTGTISLSKNPELAICAPNFQPPLIGRTVGPLGLYPDYLRVYAWRAGSTGVGFFLDPDSSAVKSLPLYNNWTTAQDIEVTRNGMYGNTYNCFGTAVPY